MSLKELVRRDFENLQLADRLRTDEATEELIFMQSIEGHAHNGAGTFQKVRYVDITIDDIVKLLGREPGQVREARQRLIDEVRQFVEETVAGKPRQKLVNDRGETFLRTAIFKDLLVDAQEVCRGLYLGGKRDNSEVRAEAEARYNMTIGGGAHYFVDQKVMRRLNLDGEKLAHGAHAEEIDRFKSEGLIVDEESYRASQNDHIRYMYIRHRSGPGQSDDAAIVVAGLLYGRDVAVGVFLADAVDTLEKYVPSYSDQDDDISTTAEKLPDLGIGWNEVLQFTALSAIPEGRELNIPDSSLRYLLLIDKHTRQTAFESHLRAVQKLPILPMPLGLNRIPSYDFYSYINRRVLEARPPVRAAAAPTAGRRALWVTEFMNPDVLTVPVETRVEDLIERMAAEKRDFAVIVDAHGKVAGVVRSSDLLRILQL